jgi:hypothetical protein
MVRQSSRCASGPERAQPEISPSVRKQPSHMPLSALMRHTEMQGEGTTSPAASTVRRVRRHLGNRLLARDVFRVQVHRHVDHGRAGQQLQLLRHQLEHRMRMAGRGPDFFKAHQAQVHQHHDIGGMRQRRHAADRETGLGLHELGIGPAHALAVGQTRASTLRSSTRLSPDVTTRMAASSDLRRKMMLLAICPRRTPKRIGRLLRGAGRVVEHDGHMRVAAFLQHRHNFARPATVPIMAPNCV